LHKCTPPPPIHQKKRMKENQQPRCRNSLMQARRALSERTLGCFSEDGNFSKTSPLRFSFFYLLYLYPNKLGENKASDAVCSLLGLCDGCPGGGETISAVALPTPGAGAPKPPGWRQANFRVLLPEPGSFVACASLGWECLCLSPAARVPRRDGGRWAAEPIRGRRREPAPGLSPPAPRASVLHR